MDFLIGPLITLIILIVLIIIIVRIIAYKSSSSSTSRLQKSLFTPKNERRGIEGERIAEKYLRKILKDDEYLLKNILLPLKNGYSTEIDNILITRKGIFCLEIKNWVGRISGDEYSEYWIQKYDDPFLHDKKRRNPYLQNEKHRIALEKKLDNQFDVFNIVLFIEIEDRSELYSPKTFALDEFIHYYRSLEDEKLTLEEVEEIRDKLDKFVATEEELYEHKKQISSRFNRH
ncbi:MAG: nuclease-related domain-containing protein [Bacilli bacterium]